MPLFHHVESEALERLRVRLSANGRISQDFLVLLAGATLVASFGLFQNSPAVIIGAMIIAPLMRPLMSLSLATITADLPLLRQSLIALLTGTLLAVSIGVVVGLCLQTLELTPEIVGRTHPTLLDLGVALAAGAVGAYCQTEEKLADTMAGVAIAVALVPPLAVVGIGLSGGHWHIASGSSLLYATNLVGITGAGSLVFLIRGYSPLRTARRGLIISMSLGLLLALPLAFSMRELILENIISARVKLLLKEKTVTFKGVQLREVSVRRFQRPMNVQATAFEGPELITPHQVKLVQDFLSKEIGAPVIFTLQLVPAREISAEEGERAPANPQEVNAPLNQEKASPTRPDTTEQKQEQKNDLDETKSVQTDSGSDQNKLEQTKSEQSASEQNNLKQPVSDQVKPGTENSTHSTD